DFNPERLTRSVALAKPPPAEDGAGTKNALAQPGEPSDTISFSLLLDATDRLATGDELAELFGILPELAALELLQSPKQAAGAARTATRRPRSPSLRRSAAWAPPARSAWPHCALCGPAYDRPGQPVCGSRGVRLHGHDRGRQAGTRPADPLPAADAGDVPARD